VPGSRWCAGVAVTPRTIIDYDLPELPGERSDWRSAAFAVRHGRLVQVEVEALEPADLCALFQAELYALVDVSARQVATEREERERAQL
jgi:hypothetical protein